MNKEFTLEYRWKCFAAKVLASNIKEDSIQYREMKRAFYSGMVDTLVEVQNRTDKFMKVLTNENMAEYKLYIDKLIPTLPKVSNPT